MAHLVDDHLAWMDTIDPDELHEVLIQLEGDPYFPQGAPLVPSDLLGKDGPSRDKEDDDP